MDYNEYKITDLDQKAYNLYCYVDENEPYMGEHHNFFDFIKDKSDYLEYYSKVKKDIRKNKLIQLSKKCYD